MSIEITSVRIKSLNIENPTQSEQKLTGVYELISSKGKVMATQSFNGYSELKFEFGVDFIRDIISDVEAKIEIDIGVQEAVKSLKK